jgi:hypothetical protein
MMDVFLSMPVVLILPRDSYPHQPVDAGWMGVNSLHLKEIVSGSCLSPWLNR